METRKCRSCQQEFELNDLDFEFCKKWNVEPLDECFECNQKHHLAFRNERCLYKRKCDATGEEIISIYASEKPYKVYKNDYWYSDQWDPLNYGRPFDFNRPFFDQFAELQLEVPRMGIHNAKCVNSDYCNTCYGNKNCYLIFGGDYNQDSMFGVLCMGNKDVLDCDFGNQNELSYMIGSANNCYGSGFIFDSKNCSDSYFLSQCASCRECILCTNLINKSYCVGNKQYSKEEYFELKKQLINGSYEQQQKNFEELKNLLKKRIVKYANVLNIENCSGDNIKNSKNCSNCYDVFQSEDMRHIIYANRAKDCYMSSMIGDYTQLMYNSISAASSYNIFCSASLMIDSSNIFYSELCMNNENIFGCISLRHKKYCILNKQYSKEEYEKLFVQIREHMKKTGEFGEFFPKKLSCFGYNETTANLYWPMTRQQALENGFKWRDIEHEKPLPQTVKIPDNIQDAPENILQEMLACEKCGKNFRIIPQEFRFYKKTNTPIPRWCPDCRYLERQSLRNPRKLWNRSCMKCRAAVESSYSPDRPETVYCEKCYLEAVV